MTIVRRVGLPDPTHNHEPVGSWGRRGGSFPPGDIAYSLQPMTLRHALGSAPRACSQPHRTSNSTGTPDSHPDNSIIVLKR
jgi:hypothetical protein